MFDQMAMPVVFALLMTALAVTGMAVFVGVRVLAARADIQKPAAPLPATDQGLPESLEANSRKGLEEG
jgi:hypothetical protein